MTIDQVRNAIGHERAAWVRDEQDRLAILVRAGRLGDAVLIRYAADDGGYCWTEARLLERCPDFDKRREPAWLQQARCSTKPPAILWDILNPEYSQRELARMAREWADSALDWNPR